MENNNNPQNAQDVPSLENMMTNDPIVIGGDQFEPDNKPEGGEGQDPKDPTNGSSDDNQNQDPPAGDPPAGDPPSVVEDDVVKLLATEERLLSADDLQLRNNIFNTFGAAGIDFKGNLLDANGQVVLNAKDLDTYIETGEVPMDGEGNQINAQGQVVRNAKDVNDSYNVVNMTKSFIEEELGYTFTDAEGKPKVYENTADGNREFAKDIAVAAQTTAVASFLENEPEFKDLFFYMKNGGKLADYANRDTDYSTIDVTNLSKEQKLSYIKQSYEKQGLKNAESILKLIEGAGDEVVNQNVSEALLNLRQLTEDEKRRNEEAYNQRIQDEQKQIQEYWEGVKSVITKGDLKSLKIPDNEKSDFFSYIAEPINAKGETREMIDAAKETADAQLLVSYIRYKGGDLSKFIHNAAKTNKLDRLRSRVGINTPVPKIENSKERTNTGESSTSFTPSIENLLG